MTFETEVAEHLDFIRARLDEAEARAKAATQGNWTVFDMDETEKMKHEPLNGPGEGWYWIWSEDRLPYYGAVMEPTKHHPNCACTRTSCAAIGIAAIDDQKGGKQEQADAEFIAHNNPPRMLSDIRQKRAMIVVIEDLILHTGAPEHGAALLLSLTEAYRDHPDCKPEWLMEVPA